MKFDTIQFLIDVLRGKKHFQFRSIHNFLWNLRKVKKNFKNEKINIVFICHRPAVWGSLKTVFEACNIDDEFNTTILAIPIKKPTGDDGKETYISEGAEEFFKDYPCRVINGYNYKTDEWFDIKSLKPDYVFYQQPYNCNLPVKYHSSQVSKYAKILYVSYFMNVFKEGVFECGYNFDFFPDVSTVFAETESTKNKITDRLKNLSSKPKVIVSGFPRFDNLDKYKNVNSNNWNFERSENITRIIWTPRWCTDEGICSFFDYKDKMIDYVENNKNIDFIFRPHPQMFVNFNATGEFSVSETEEYKRRFEKLDNAKIDTQKEYLATLYSSDIMITDVSSIVVEYFLTGKPVIYCHKKDFFADIALEISKGFYKVNNWEELIKTVEMLKQGNDPMKQLRQEIIKEAFYMPEGGAGNKIKNLIKKDFAR